MENLNVYDVLKLIKNKKYLELTLELNSSGYVINSLLLNIPVEERHQLTVSNSGLDNISFGIVVYGKLKNTLISASITSNFSSMKIDTDILDGYYWVTFRSVGKEHISFIFKK